MSLLRFFFGHGAWVLWHIAFYAIVLIFVVFLLYLFGRELKAPGEKPDTASPGSMIVFCIGLALGFVTFVDGSIMFRGTELGWLSRFGIAAGMSIGVMTIMLPLNNSLALKQSHPWFHANVWVSVLIVLGNLYMLHFGETR